MSDPTVATESKRTKEDSRLKEDVPDMAPDSLQQQSSQGYNLPKGVEVSWSASEGGVLATAGWVREHADTTRKRISSASLMMAVFEIYERNSKKFGQVQDRALVAAWASHPDAFFPGPLEGPDDEVVLIQLRKLVSDQDTLLYTAFVEELGFDPSASEGGAEITAPLYWDGLVAVAAEISLRTAYREVLA